MNIQANSMAIILFCGHLCLGENIVPLEPKEWTDFAAILLAKNMQPGDVLNYSKTDFTDKLAFSPLQAERYELLISRSAGIAFELESLANAGIQLITRADSLYPQRLKKVLGKASPPLFYAAGNLNLANGDLIGFVGSRAAGDEDAEFTRIIVKKCVGKGYGIVSGGAKGIDSIAVQEAIGHGGFAVEFIADSLQKRIRNTETIHAVRNNRLLILSVAKPDAGFNTGFAMMRNKYIYANSLGTVVVKSDYNKGGTWTGASENLKRGWTNLFCWNKPSYKGNLDLIGKGAFPIDTGWDVNLNVEPKTTEPDSVQLSLFD
ncbi:MAG: DNA-processing protein DprA [Eubacteriales bacterium]